MSQSRCSNTASLRATATTALFLAFFPPRAVGVYGLIVYLVTQRTHEIGIRLALGAAREKVFLDLFGEGARLVLAGLVVGVVAALGLRGVVSALLFGVTPGDPVSYVMAAVAFSGVALAAVVIPAHRASRVDPITALRYE